MTDLNTPDHTETFTGTTDYQQIISIDTLPILQTHICEYINMHDIYMTFISIIDRLETQRTQHSHRHDRGHIYIINVISIARRHTFRHV